MKKKLLKWGITPLIAVLGFISLNSFTEEGESSEGSCDKCVVKDSKGKVIFSCKTVANETCKESAAGYSVSCANAKKC